MDLRRIEIAVEALCARGCREVNIIIERLDHGDPVDGAEMLSQEERKAVLAELRAIMAVYDKPCDL